MTKKCACTNDIKEFYADGSQPDLCEWCEYPEPPYYKVTTYEELDIVVLHELDLFNRKVVMRSGNIEVIANNETACDAILEDYKKLTSVKW